MVNETFNSIDSFRTNASSTEEAIPANGMCKSSHKSRVNKQNLQERGMLFECLVIVCGGLMEFYGEVVAN